VPLLAKLRQQIEELALRFVVAEPDGSLEWLPALEKIRDQAAREQAGRVVAAATAMIGNLENAGDAAALGVLSEALQEGFTQLQQALESEPEQSASPPLALSQDPELLSDFILESRQNLADLESQLLVLERDPCDSEALNSVFRGFHTIKGLAGFLELWGVQKLAHETEALLDRARSRQWSITAEGIDVILESADHLRQWLSHLESALQHQPSEAPRADETLLGKLRALSAGTGQPEEPAASLARLAAVVVPEKAVPEKAVPEKAVPEKAAPEKNEEAPAAATAQPAKPKSETMAVKVDTAKLDYLVDMAGELVIAESLVRHDPELATVKSQVLQRKMAQMTRITAELQKTAMAMRLVPIGPLFRRMSRLVRDLSRQCGKRVRMETGGDEIELDRTIVEELADPLMHMVRNAVDHAIEPPAERERSGKDPTARLLLKAQHQAGQVVIEVTDDGRGLDSAKIKAKALQKGLIAPGEDLSETETNNLIFEPGFSTAAQVTNVSGRGVGMDVVRQHVEKLRGRIEIRSTAGRGATFLLKLPLTLAIIDGLVVAVGIERYIVPLFAVREMFRPADDTVWTVQQRGEMALVRGSLLPVLRLYRKFGVKPRSENPTDSVMVVAEVEGARYCLVVDELIGKQEVVIKTLGETFRNVTGIAGGAILGDGRVGLILDLDRLMRDSDHEPGR
jgi:two-component system chemotaxis sensor kinase CheA